MALRQLTSGVRVRELALPHPFMKEVSHVTKRSTLVKFLVGASAALIGLTLAGCSPSKSPQPQPSTTSVSLDRGDPWQEVRSKYPDAVIPDVKLVKYSTIDSWPQAQADCLASQGFPAETTADGGVTFYVPADQDESYIIAQTSCHIMYPLDPAFETPLDDSQLTMLYEYQTGELLTCVSSAGYSAPEPPSLETFKATYAQDGAWTPFGLLDLSDDEWSTLNQSCPQLPPDLYSAE